MRFHHVLIAFSLFFSPLAKAAGLLDYIQDYRLGVSFGAYGSQSILSYQHQTLNPLPSGCTLIDDSMSCQQSIQDTSSVNFFVQQVFKRQGWFYFSTDLGFSTFKLNSGTDLQKNSALLEDYVPQPIEKIDLALSGLSSKLYIQFGITPPYVPDLLFSAGIGYEYLVGSIRIEDQKEMIRAGTNLVMLAVELVWMRFGDGSLSSAAYIETVGKSIDLKAESIGQAHQFALNPGRADFEVLKFVLPWHL